MIALGLVELGFIPLHDFLVVEADGVVTLTWLSAQPQPSDADIAAAAQTALQEQAAEAARELAIRTDPTRVDILQRLSTSTPAQIGNFVDNQVTGTATQQITAVKNLIKIILLTIALDQRT